MFTFTISNGRRRCVEATVEPAEGIQRSNLRSSLYCNYNTIDETNSLGVSHSASHTTKALADQSSGLVKLHSIERPDLLHFGNAQVCDLVGKSTVQAMEGFCDDDNNKLAMSPTLLSTLNGQRNKYIGTQSSRSF